MNIRVIMEPEANEISQEEESHFFDRKAASIDGKKVQKIAVAFANADDGEFMIGIADDQDEADPTKRWQGVMCLEDLNGKLQAVFEIYPTLDLKYEILKAEKKIGLCLKNISREKLLFT